MGRLINTDDLNNVVQVQSKEYGRLAVEIEHIVEDMVRQVTTAQDISPLKQLKEELFTLMKLIRLLVRVKVCRLQEMYLEKEYKMLF